MRCAPRSTGCGGTFDVETRSAEVKQLDVALDDSGARTFRAKLSVSFKYEGGS